MHQPIVEQPKKVTTSVESANRVGQLYRAAIDALLLMGLARAVLVATIISILLSVAVCGAAIHIMMRQSVFGEWMYFAIITPAIVAPLVSLAIFTMAYELAEARAALANVAATDPLTGVGNRRKFFEFADRDLARSRREKTPIALVMLDIDHFKALNDRYGHASGDDALVAVASACSARLRQTDLLCRWGGEEFIALLPMCGFYDAVRVAETLRKAVESLRVEGIDQVVTVSLGATEIGFEDDLRSAIARADEQLYRAKAAGRNQVQPPLILTPPA